MRYAILTSMAALCILAPGCGERPLNSPYPGSEELANTFYSSFSERPKHLDPASAYSANEYSIIGLVYEPPFQYHYLQRPYVLVPRTATSLPEPTYLDADQQPLPDNARDDQVAYSSYEIEIRPGIQFAPHPAFARDQQGKYRYHQLTSAQIAPLTSPHDLPETGSRELSAADYVYQIKRLADPRIHSPLFGLMSEHIVGLRELGAQLRTLPPAENEIRDLREFELSGVTQLDRYRYRILLYGKYPQFPYWLAMPFFSPMPVEAELFYGQTELREKNISLDWFPVGSGPYQLIENNPNRRIKLIRNTNYHDDFYPTDGLEEDDPDELLRDAGARLPFIDQVILSLEKESIPIWNKFLQGYYDMSGIHSDSFDQAIVMGDLGDVGLSDSMLRKGISLSTTVSSSTFYTGVNMLDPTIGGYSERAKQLRRALAIAIDQEENISIFANGRGITMQGPIPPGIFGYRSGAKGINPHLFDWVGGRALRKPISKAKEWLARAGYPQGIDPTTGKPLLLYLDTPATGPDAKASFDWLRKQFRKVDIELVIRSTNYNRFQEKMRKGNAQIYQWGWNADYPDPENFLFLFYGPNAKAITQGENASNYQNEAFDRLFEEMRNMPNGPERQALIDRMTEIVREDTPWLTGFHPKRFALHHQWLTNVKPHELAHDTIKYLRIDPLLRNRLRTEWNAPVWWPLYIVGGLLAVLIVPALAAYRRSLYRRT